MAAVAVATLSGSWPVLAEETINVAVAANSPPMLFKSARGKIEGVEMEIFSNFCRENGYLMNIKEYTFDGMLGAVINGQAEVAFSAISITPKRKEVIDFSAPYFNNSWNLVSLSARHLKITDLSQLKQYKIGYPRGMAYADLIRDDLEPKNYYSRADAKLYPSYAEVFEDLKNGNLDLAFVEDPVLANYKTQRHYPVEVSYSFKNKDTLGFGFNKHAPRLRVEFDAYLKEQGPKKIGAIVDKWMK
jgi:polar amino acid transport system substrate-binding protein